MNSNLIYVIVGGILGVVAVLGYAYLTRDPVAAHYNGMAVLAQQSCEAEGTADACGALAQCYRAGIEGVFPRDLVDRILAGEAPSEVVSASVRAEMDALEADCALEAEEG